MPSETVYVNGIVSLSAYRKQQTDLYSGQFSKRAEREIRYLPLTIVVWQTMFRGECYGVKLVAGYKITCYTTTEKGNLPCFL
jgi:hypothetical protein